MGAVARRIGVPGADLAGVRYLRSVTDADELRRDLAASSRVVVVGAGRFHDLWERNCKEYSHRFIWCCFALAWGIRQYDAGKSQPAPVSPQPSAQPTEVTA